MGPCVAYCLCSRVGSVAVAVPVLRLLCAPVDCNGLLKRATVSTIRPACQPGALRLFLKRMKSVATVSAMLPVESRFVFVTQCFLQPWTANHCMT